MSTAPAPPQPVVSLIEFALWDAGLSEDDVVRGCAFANQNAFTAVLVRPADLEAVVRQVNSSVTVAAVIDFPDGAATTATKGFAVRDAIRRGAREIHVPLNTGKLRSRQFHYLEMEFVQLAQHCHESAARLTVHTQTEWLDEELKLLACRLARRSGADAFAVTSLPDLALVREQAKDRYTVKFSASTLNVDEAIQLRDAGCSRFLLSDPKPLLAEWRARSTEAAHLSPPAHA